MTPKDDGGPAFPQEVRYIAPNQQTGSYGPCGGMSLRDYFAAKATEEDVKAWSLGPVVRQIRSEPGGRFTEFDAPLQYTREQAKYRYADAMLKARSA